VRRRLSVILEGPQRPVAGDLSYGTKSKDSMLALLIRGSGHVVLKPGRSLLS
jgi:hypothetical protein